MAINKGIISDTELFADARSARIASFAVGVGVLRGESVLIVHRVTHDFLGGLWELPGGGVLPNESLTEAVMRELKEETGLTVQAIHGLFTGFDYENAAHQLVRQFNYSIAVFPGDITLNPLEHDEYAWVQKEDVLKYPMSTEMLSSVNSILHQNSTMKSVQYTVVVIGLGHQGRKEHLPSILNNPRLKLVGVVDCQKDTVNSISRQYQVPGFQNVDTLLNQIHPDIAVVCVPHCEYEAILTSLLKAHVAIFKEKPFACTFPDAMKLHRKIIQTNGQVMVHVQRRFSPYYEAAKPLLKKIGKPFFIEGHYFLYIDDPHSGWRGKRKSAGGGCIIDMGYHFIDLLLLYLGLPDQVHAEFGSFAKENVLYDAEDTASILINYSKKKLFGTLNFSRYIGPKDEYLQIVGTEGSILVKNNAIMLYKNNGEIVQTISPDDFKNTNAIDYFVDVLEKRVPNISDSTAHLEHVAFIEACYRSQKLHSYSNPTKIMEEDLL
jgi:predicted dehydrogenase/8-oxo-dGTP pyrophosphatase MutT (NUDIX family)